VIINHSLNKFIKANLKHYFFGGCSLKIDVLFRICACGSKRAQKRARRVRAADPTARAMEPDIDMDESLW
jgi:hypothetical protein